MADSMSYPVPNPYINQYYPAHVNHGPVHVVSQPRQQESTQRKRPKYTRSKTGCLTCRVKKIKCDETKPSCMRCTHGQRDCTWPEGVPPRKKPAPRKDASERPSTAGSSGISEASTPPTREATPPRRGPLELGLPPLVARRPSDPYAPISPASAESNMRRDHDRGGSCSVYPHYTPNGSSVVPMIPELSAYPSQSRYDNTYPSSTSNMNARHSMNSSSVGRMGPVNQWGSHSMLPPMMDSYVVPQRSRSELAGAYYA
ncbi:hypothetical protein HGRIS_002518 [Hohenbuehelia grisea]|uniref:Zn(2)-C6 fungal-type domain-containing protein n=1 Tax=Hohenbuehelia grisea TaxID=104357 RepID=A0ABR3JKV9_9AGAR